MLEFCCPGRPGSLNCLGPTESQWQGLECPPGDRLVGAVTGQIQVQGLLCIPAQLTCAAQAGPGQGSRDQISETAGSTASSAGGNRGPGKALNPDPSPSPNLMTSRPTQGQPHGLAGLAVVQE